MSKAVPQIQKYMTPMPDTIDVEASVAVATKMMREKKIRHLPVMSGGRLVGILSDRDLLLIESLRDVDVTKVRVDDAMTANPYTVPPDAPVNEVARSMAEHKYGSAVVVQNGRVVGVFTTTDACHVLAEIWETRLK